MSFRPKSSRQFLPSFSRRRLSSRADEESSVVAELQQRCVGPNYGPGRQFAALAMQRDIISRLLRGRSDIDDTVVPRISLANPEKTSTPSRIALMATGDVSRAACSENPPVIVVIFSLRVPV